MTFGEFSRILGVATNIPEWFYCAT